MVKHDHFCGTCQIFSTDPTFEKTCWRCGVLMAITSSPAVKKFRAFWHPHMDHEPVHIPDGKTLDKELEKRNLHIKEAPKNERQVRLPQSREEALNV